MVTYRDEGVTLLIFTSFKFRLMGKGEKHKRVLQNFLRKLPWKARTVSRDLLLCLPLLNEYETHIYSSLHGKYYNRCWN